MSTHSTSPCSCSGSEISSVDIDAKAAIFKALGHPIRLRIVEMLLAGECCVCTLHENSQRDMSTISSHLKVLKNASIIQSRQVGKQVFYSLSLGCLATLFRCIDQHINKQ